MNYYSYLSQQHPERYFEYNFFESHHGHSVCDGGAAHAKKAIKHYQTDKQRPLVTNVQLAEVISRVKNHFAIPCPKVLHDRRRRQRHITASVVVIVSLLVLVKLLLAFTEVQTLLLLIFILLNRLLFVTKQMKKVKVPLTPTRLNRTMNRLCIALSSRTHAYILNKHY